MNDDAAYSIHWQEAAKAGFPALSKADWKRRRDEILARRKRQRPSMPKDKTK